LGFFQEAEAILQTWQPPFRVKEGDAKVVSKKEKE
jgi:hypothetical protein